MSALPTQNLFYVLNPHSPEMRHVAQLPSLRRRSFGDLGHGRNGETRPVTIGRDSHAGQKAKF